MEQSASSRARELTAFIQRRITEESLYTYQHQPIISPAGNRNTWLFDLRPLFTDPEVLTAISELFWSERYTDSAPRSIGGIETNALPLITALVLEGRRRGHHVRGFYIRKERKEQGLQRQIEGYVNGSPIVLVDDILNSGNTLLRQVATLEAHGYSISEVFAVVQYQSTPRYSELSERVGCIRSLFSVTDFGLTQPNKTQSPPTPNPFTPRWYFQSANADFFHIVPKSGPVVGPGSIFLGSDQGTLWALNKKTGDVQWRHTIKYGTKRKRIFSTPLLYQNAVYFGAYDGSLRALHPDTGTLLWRYNEADWIGSSPTASPRDNFVFVGLEFATRAHRGGLAALNAISGAKQWWQAMPHLVHCSPAYNDRFRLVAVGDNGGIVRFFDARTGKLRWEFSAQDAVKSGIAFDASGRYCVFGSFDACVYVLDLKRKRLHQQLKTHDSIYATPLVSGRLAYTGSHDKHVYCFDIKTGEIQWQFGTGGKVFASPILFGGCVYVGATDGGFYKLDAKTGVELGYAQFSERIVNTAAFDTESEYFYVPTFANELYCITDSDLAGSKSRQIHQNHRC